MKKLNESEKKVFRNVCKELYHSLKELQSVKKAVSIFGSARYNKDLPYYNQILEISETLSASGYDIITGGGGGIMEKANEGAKHTESIGLSIDLPQEQDTNKFVSKEVIFKYFAIRKMMFIKYSKAFIVCPGGYGTLDEAFEILTLVQTGCVKPIPIIFVNREYWSGCMEWLKNTVVADGLLTKKELSLIRLADTPDEVLSEIRKG